MSAASGPAPSRPITALLTADDDAKATAERLAHSGLVGSLLLLVPPGGARGLGSLGSLPCTEIETAEPGSGAVLADLLDRVSAPLLLRIEGDMDPHTTALRRMCDVIGATGAAMVYGDFLDQQPDGSTTAHPLSDHQEGSLQDTFPFGPLRLWSIEVARRALARHGGVEQRRWMAWYDLRLKASIEAPVVRLPEPLGVLRPRDRRRSGEQVFDYLTATRQRQIEAETVVTEHLERLGARATGPFEAFEAAGSFPVEASVVIPVRNRARTILDAVSSALEQQLDAPFNVIVVDNHSTDGTTEALAERAARDPRLVHVVPERTDLGIGGCWNVAAHHELAGRYVVQLDSDDIYSGPGSLAAMVEALRSGCGMAVGSYTLVNMALEEIPPGLIDHREWTDDNGPNNALRIGGFGAPRAFPTALLRRHPLPNASYGEDYGIALRISRTYRVGRVYESLYLCRRWEDNSDADLPPATKARYQTYKDRLRTLEILARRHAGQAGGSE
ncbi:MAG TPA: glycosyltransferase family 2 protein [Deltaproteobacteria bacterium]|nr:glycosyltransferase family 2 protein [Deltaproteobacteria bacterium]